MRMDPEADMANRSTVFGAVEPPPDDPPPSQPDGPRTVLVLLVVFKFGMDKAQQDAIRIYRAVGGMPRSPVLHGDRQMGIVLQTSYSAAELRAHLEPVLDAGSIFNAWVFTPGADVECMLPLDPFKDAVEAAWRNVRRYNEKRTIHRRLPRKFFELDREVEEYGRKGVATVAILDDHPFDRKRGTA